MRRLLMTAQAAFDLARIGTTLAPALPADALKPPYPERVTLRLPGGREITTRARFSMTHFTRPYHERTIENTWMLVVALVDVGAEDVPVGAEVWIEARDEISPLAPR